MNTDVEVHIMPTEREPEIGSWYRNLQGQSFEVIALDEGEGIVEIQYFDGAVEELDMDTWYELELVEREPPEDWSGPFDDLEKDDFGDTEVARHPEDWSGPLDTIEWEE